MLKRNLRFQMRSSGPVVTRRSPDEVNVSYTRIPNDSALKLQYRFIRELGEGNFGYVSEYERLRDGEHFAIKTLQKDRVGHSNLKLFEREVAVMKAMAHPHIVQLTEIFENGDHLFLVLELCELGSLSRVLKEMGPLPEPLARDVMRQLGEAISYMHRMGVVHRDIKLQNVLATRRNPRTGRFEADQMFVKLADFSLAILKKPDENLQCVCGTLSYMSPEVLDDKIYGQAADNWSMGVILYQLLSGEPPFQPRDGEELRQLVREPIAFKGGAVWRSVSDQAVSCIRSLLTVDPVHRMSASELLTHPWLTGHDGPLHKPNVVELMHLFHEEQQLRVSSSGASSERGRDSGRASGASSSPASTSADNAGDPAAHAQPERATPPHDAAADFNSSRPPLGRRLSRSALKLADTLSLSHSSSSLSVAVASGSRSSSRNCRKPSAAPSAANSERSASGYTHANSSVRTPAGGTRKPKSITPTNLRD